MRLHPLIAVLVILTAGVAFASGMAVAPHEDTAYSYALGSATGTMVGAGLFGVLAYFLSRRSRLVTNITVGVVSTLMLVGSGWRLVAHTGSKEAAQNSALLNRLAEQSEANLAEQRAEFERTGQVALDSKRANEAIEQMSSTAAQVTDDNGRMMQASLRVVKELGATVADYESKVGEAQKIGGSDGEGIATVADIDRRVRAWRETAALAAKATARVRSLSDDVAAAVATTGASPQAQRAFLSGFRAQKKFGVMIEIREQEEKVITGVLQQLAVLRNSFGDWRYDPSGGLVFEVDADREAFNAAADRINAAAKRVSDAQAELMKPEPSPGGHP